MRSLRIVLGSLGLALVGLLAWLQLGHKPDSAVRPPTARVDSGLDAAPPGPSAATSTRIEVDPEQGAEGGPAVDQGAEEQKATVVVLARSKEDSSPLQGVRTWLMSEPRQETTLIGVAGSKASFGSAPVTDSDGRAEITVPSGRRLRLQTDDEAEQCARANLPIGALAPGETREVELYLSTRADVHFVGRVVDDAEETPIEGARVCVGAGTRLIHLPSSEILATPMGPGGIGRPAGPIRSSSSDEPLCFATDADGYFELESRSWLDEFIRVDAPGFAWALVPIDALSPTRATAREVRMSRSASLRILVLDRNTLPAANVRIRLSTWYGWFDKNRDRSGRVLSSDDLTWEATASADGRARIGDLPPGVPLDIDLEFPEEGAQRLAERPILRPGEARSLVLRCPSTAVVTGWLRMPDGSAARQSEVWMKTGSDLPFFQSYEREFVRTAQTDEYGRFRFPDVVEGSWFVGAAADGPYASVAEVVHVRAGMADREVLLTAWEDLYIRGTVVDPSGRPCQATVWVRSAKNNASSDAETDDQGRFELGPLAPGGYELNAHPLPPSRERLTRTEPVRVEAGSSDVVVTLPLGGSITGMVVDAITGAGVSADVLITPAQGQDGEDWVSGTVSTEDGMYHVDGLSPGIWCLSASTVGGACGVLANVRVDAGEAVKSVRLPVRPGARLQVHYDGDKDFASFDVLEAGVVVARTELERGTSGTWVVPSGRIDVHCTEWLDEDFERSRTRTRQIDLAVGVLGEIRFGPEDDQN